jgi:dipeptidyl aminopeptidase/acylaminoacyl peptidase
MAPPAKIAAVPAVRFLPFLDPRSQLRYAPPQPKSLCDQESAMLVVQDSLFRLVSLVSFAALLNACGQETPVSSAPASEMVAVTEEDYRRAESFLSANVNDLVSGNILAQYWQDDGRLVYRRSIGVGSEYLLADPSTASSAPLFDAEALAAALTAVTGEEAAASDLALSQIELDPEQQILGFRFDGEDYQLNLVSMNLQQEAESPDNEILSPDGSKAAFIQDYNLWVRDTVSNELTQLTFDGVEDYGYATNNAGWIRDDGPVLLWSPDSRSIATFRHDGRNVGEMYLYDTRVGHVELDAWKYPLPGDEHIFMIERIVVHLEEEPRIVPLRMPPDPHRSTTADHIADFDGRFLDVEWSEDSAFLAFVSSSRDHKSATLRLTNPDTGDVRDIYNETVATYYESGASTENWRLFVERNEFLWFSEKDNWGHLYLHDLTSGQEKRQLTSGNWTVLEVQQVDLDNEQIYFTGSNREAGDPYFHYLYRVNMDGTGLTLLTPEPAHHVISWSEGGEYFTDTYSTPTQPAVSLVKDRNGNVVQELVQTDISQLLATGWVAPEPFVVKARDQQTDLYGLLYKPSNFDPARSYPVLNYLYPGPQTGSVGRRSFSPARSDKQAVAELGFVVVEVDAMGTPGRSKSFHDAYYGNMGDNGLPDQITAIRQLAASRPWMDIERIGIWGHSGGGFASTAGILRYPDFYKVAVSSAGNHDNRNYEDDWGEKWQGLLETYPETSPDDPDAPRTNYDNQANQLLVENLQGKLLLAHGLMDDNVHPSNTLLMVQALVEAEKDFDLVLLPDSRHGFANSRYFMKRRWDYFVRHLISTEPPADFRFGEDIR